MRIFPWFCALVLFAGFFPSCTKKQFKFSGEETDAQAVQKCIRLSEKKKFQEAVECLEIFKSRFPNSTYALDAELQIADNYYNKKDWLLAAESYKLYARLHPNSEKLDYSYYRAGLAYEKLLPKGVDRDQTNLPDAEESYAMVFRRFPESPYAAEAQARFDAVKGRAAKKNMYVGRFYFKGGEYRAAIPRYLEVLQDYPGLGFDEEALYRLALAYHRLKLAEQAKGAAQIMQEKFPQSPKTKKVVKLILGGSNG